MINDFNKFSLYDHIPNGIFVLQNDYRIVFWNKALEIITGFSKDKMIGQNILEIYPHFDKKLYKMRIDNIFNSGASTVFSSQLHKYIIPVKDQDGSFKRQQTVVTPYKNIESNEILAIFTIEDVTEATKRINDYKEIRDRAFNEIEERQKIEFELRDSEKKLKELNAGKDKFFSILAHDLKNPFMGLMGITDLLIEDFNKLSSIEVIELLRELKFSSKKIYNLLVSLLDWSLITSGKMELNPEVFGLKEIINDVLQIMMTNAKQKEIELFGELCEDLKVNADKKSVHTILRNLISNAVKYTKRNGRIRVSCRSKNEDEIEVFISDTGIGMSQEIIDNLFKIDINQSKPGTENETGTGLGLILCKELVEKNGGVLSFNSIEGRGTTFNFTIKKYNIN